MQNLSVLCYYNKVLETINYEESFVFSHSSALYNVRSSELISFWTPVKVAQHVETCGEPNLEKH